MLGADYDYNNSCKRNRNHNQVFLKDVIVIVITD